MQIDGGKNDKFAAYSDAGGLTVGHYNSGAATLRSGNTRGTIRWPTISSWVPSAVLLQPRLSGLRLRAGYPNADQSPAKDLISAVAPDGVTLLLADASPKSALDGPPKFVRDGTLTPDFHAVNTMQPAYQPSGNKPGRGWRPGLCRPAKPTTLPPQTATTIGDLLSQKGSIGPGMPAPGRWRWTARAMRQCRASRLITNPSTISPASRPHAGPCPASP